jgi:hypothetical protein
MWLQKDASHTGLSPKAVNLYYRGQNLCLTLATLLLFAISSTPAFPPEAAAHRMARAVIQNELRAEAHDDSLWSYRKLAKRDGRELLFEYCETQDGTLHRLLAVNGHPLNARQRKAEDARLQGRLRSPLAVREEQRKEDGDAAQERKFLKSFPDNFLFREVAHQGDLTTLEFVPNPKFHPSGYLGRVLHDMQGKMVVDSRQKRLVSIQGRLKADVKFWRGLLGVLHSGGTFSVSMQNVAPGDWELKSLDVEMQGKALLFKTIGVQQHEVYSNYIPMPAGATLATAAARLGLGSASR